MKILTKGKLMLLGLLLSLGVTANAADVGFDTATKSFTGTFDLAPYYSAVGIIVAAIAVIAAIGLAIRQFKRVG